ncbi:glycosyltransferase family 4 protein [Frankia sp. AgKG'84/4]|uniref:glycosyltransferase family 4 protein n=1 Tax=Frankia sp. AgKG'84/4 TaxID=573490 RepID=UPI00200E31EC|nr:glycosyltransferase family 4 protein [Frankia sp. AgKG'84/4]MCL9793722.1 glycosyltransferase family 4 protein [Frankia sp. AgKG'84/4]
MEIVFLCEQYPPIIWDGAGVYTHDIAHALVALGHRVHIVCAQGRRRTDEDHDGVQVHRRPLLRLPVSRYLGALGRPLQGANHPRDSLALRFVLAISYAFWLRRLNLRPDVIETQDGETRGLRIAMKRDVPLVIHLHTPTMMDVRLREGKLHGRGALADRIDRFSALRADARTAPSELIVTTLRDFGWLKKTTDADVIPYPFDRSSYAQVAPVRGTDQTMLVVGRLEWRKGLDVLLDAAALLKERGLAPTVVFAGQSSGVIDGVPTGTWLERRAVELGVAYRFTGHLSRPELVKAYEEARVVVVPSRFESFSIAGLEGMASGRPVVATATTGVATWVAKWEGGTVVPPEDPRALADGLEPYLTDPELAATVGARGRVGTAELEPRRIAVRRVEVYQKAIDRHRERLAGRRRLKPAR